MWVTILAFARKRRTLLRRGSVIAVTRAVREAKKIMAEGVLKGYGGKLAGRCGRGHNKKIQQLLHMTVKPTNEEETRTTLID